MLYLTPFITAYLLTLSAVLGAVLASFLGCAAARHGKGESVLRGRSRCDSCGHPLGVLDLVPVFGWLLRRGRCKYCGERIPASCVLGELVMAVFFPLFLARYDTTPVLALNLFFLCILYYLSLTDLDRQIIPDKALLLAALVRLGWFFWQDLSWKGLLALVIDGLSLSLPVLILVLFMEHLMKREAMGGGDIKLLAVLGLYLGWQRGIIMLLFACFTGIIGAAIAQKKGKEGIPFGPFLALGAALAFVLDVRIISWYTGLIGL